jgi:hypothetical protein
VEVLKHKPQAMWRSLPCAQGRDRKTPSR